MTVGWRGAAGGGGGGGGGGSRSGWSSSSWTTWTAWTWAATWPSQWQSSEGRLWTQTNEAMPEYVSLDNDVFGLIIMFVLGVVVGAIGPMRMIQRLCGPWPCAPANENPASQMKEKTNAVNASPFEHVRDTGTQSDDLKAHPNEELKADPDDKGKAEVVKESGCGRFAAVPDLADCNKNTHSCLDYDAVKRNGEKYDPNNVRARALPVMATLNELSKRLLVGQPFCDGWREVRPERDWMTPEIILRTNAVTLHRFTSKAHPSELKQFVEITTPTNWDVKIVSTTLDMTEFDLMHRRVAHVFWEVAKTLVMELAKDLHEEFTGWVEPDRDEDAGPACAAIGSGGIYSIHLDPSPRCSQEEPNLSDDEPWDRNLEQTVMDTREAYGTASASGINGSGAYGSAPDDTVVEGGFGRGSSRRDETTDSHKIDWWKYTAQDIRRILRSMAMKRKCRRQR